jgi:hypothetical protein
MLDAEQGQALHGAMDTPAESPGTTAKALRVWRALALVLAVLIVALVFGAYSQPELLLNYSGLRYCG